MLIFILCVCMCVLPACTVVHHVPAEARGERKTFRNWGFSWLWAKVLGPEPTCSARAERVLNRCTIYLLSKMWLKPMSESCLTGSVPYQVVFIYLRNHSQIPLEPKHSRHISKAVPSSRSRRVSDGQLEQCDRQARDMVLPCSLCSEGRPHYFKSALTVKCMQPVENILAVNLTSDQACELLKVALVEHWLCSSCGDPR